MLELQLLFFIPGTGKSLLIHAMKSMIYEAFGENSYALLGPTGVSALNINGSTIHSKLIIFPKTRELLPLNPGTLHDFKQKFEKTLFVIIDEYSMVGCNMLNNIEKRLREALDKNDEEYGGIFIYFFGDIQQLPPVGDSPVYKDTQVSSDYVNGSLLYKNIAGSIELSQVKRQADVNFTNLLNNISDGIVDKTDYNTLKTRFTTSVDPTERESFKDAIRLFPTIPEVDDYNRHRLETLKHPGTSLPVPVARIPAIHNCTAAITGTENEAGGLRPVLYLAKGAKIMLRANLWTERGLVNGSIGHIVDILYNEGASPPDEPPAALICRFDTYKGPYLDDNEKTVVIEPMIKQWTNRKGADCTRIQFPVSLCYACSIHKSQGLTLEKVYIKYIMLSQYMP